MRSWVITTIPSSPTRRGCPPSGSRAELDPTIRVPNLAEYLDRIDSTVQYSWLLEIARTFHRFRRTIGSRPRTIGELLDRADHERDGASWDREVWKTSRLEAVFLTNEFDDPLEAGTRRRTSRACAPTTWS